MEKDVSNGEPKIQDVLEAISEFSTAVDKRFNAVDSRFDAVDARFDRLEVRVTRLESQMVTKEYLDDKLADLKGDILTVIRKEDRRVTALIDVLRKKNVIDDFDVEGLERLQPLMPIP